MNLPLDMICTSHGVIWRNNPKQTVERYLQWADSYKENQVTILYDTMWGGTRIMAENIAKGIEEIDKTTNVKLFNVSSADKNDIITEVFKSKGIAVGSPSINKGVLSAIAGILEEVRRLAFKDKKAVSFGCYGWSGESPKMISALLEKSGFEVMDKGIMVLWNPDEESINKSIDYGKRLAVYSSK